MAIACFRLFTLPPWPYLPLRSVPCFRRRMALSTDLEAPLVYRRLPPRRARVAGIRPPYTTLRPEMNPTSTMTMAMTRSR